MVDRKNILKISATEGVPQATVEKDFALSVALAKICESDLADDVIFKGGTAIRKVYFEKARFSEDLDFSVKTGIEKGVILSKLKKIFPGEENSIMFMGLEEERTSAGLKASAKFVGPLEYPQRIRFDFNLRENLLKKPEKRELIDHYNIGKHSLNVMGIEEIFAEKIHALSSRAAPRDLYDTWFLTRNKVKLDKELVAGKLSYYQEKFDKNRIGANIDNMKAKWQSDLSRLLSQPPNFEEISEKVKKELSQFNI